MKVYTEGYQPFRLGGDLSGPIATEIAEYERVMLTEEHAGMVVENPVKKLHHVFLEACGALVGTGPVREYVIAQARTDAETGDPAIMREQIKQGKKDCKSAEVLSFYDFFSMFKGEARLLYVPTTRHGGTRSNATMATICGGSISQWTPTRAGRRSWITSLHPRILMVTRQDGSGTACTVARSRLPGRMGSGDDLPRRQPVCDHRWTALWNQLRVCPRLRGAHDLPDQAAS